MHCPHCGALINGVEAGGLNAPLMNAAAAAPCNGAHMPGIVIFDHTGCAPVGFVPFVIGHKP